ncbi:MAG: hypothetical protein HKN93_05350, partial [Acidimicrobiia bacterium]|nr:hypothetical protein [Acidimicrobiia bacterium]
ASVAGLFFVGGLHQRLAGQVSSAGAWAALAGGIGTVIAVLAGSAIMEAAATVDSLAGDPQVAKALWLLEHGFFNALVGPPLIVFTLGISTVAIKHGDPPRWVGWMGVVSAAGLTLNIALGLGSLAVVGFVWVLVLAIVVTISSPREQHS